MICQSCDTVLPDEARACWKCGTQIAATVANAPAKNTDLDLLLKILTFLVACALFVCVGWSVPFMVWGTITSAANQYPQWSGLSGVVSGIAFVAAAIVFFGGVWWGTYWLLKRVTATTVGG